VPVVLVDTSIWAEVERGRFNLREVVPARDVAICPPIAQELLQGAADGLQYMLVWETISASRMLDDPMPFDRFEEASQIFRECRAAGYRLASSYDCVIAACAIYHRVPLLQRDQDFENIAAVTSLKLLPNV
jgi:predicted nucleic acid-binding protein